MLRGKGGGRDKRKKGEGTFDQDLPLEKELSVATGNVSEIRI